MSMLDEIRGALGASGAPDRLAEALGTSSAETDALIGASLPAIMGGLGAQSDEAGLPALVALLDDDGGAFAEQLDSFFARGDRTGLASRLVTALFGSRRSAVESYIADVSGGAMSVVSRLLPLLTPAVLSLLARTKKDDELDDEALGAQLATIGATGPLGDILASTTAQDRAGFVAGIASIREEGGLAALVPATHVAPVGAGGAVTEAVTGLGWLPTIVLPVLALIAGLVLWQCAGTDDDPTSDSESAEVAIAIAVAIAIEPTPVPQPTATP